MKTKDIVYNFSYFLKEAKTLFKVDFLSNIFSILSIGLVFFILALVISGWWISNHIVQVIEKEAEVNLYFDEKLQDIEISKLIVDIKAIDGVEEATLIHEDESYNRMVEILGSEANILELFEENPFNAFIEVQVHIDEIDPILEKLEALDHVEYIRDNKKVIDRMKDIIIIFKLLGVLAVTAIGVSTVVVISHIIRQGMYNNREQINTLKLLGAPEFFIGFPFLLEGLFLTMVGGVLASILLMFVLKYAYGQLETSLPFIPLPLQEDLMVNMVRLILAISGGLGVLGSLFGGVDSSQ